MKMLQDSRFKVLIFSMLCILMITASFWVHAESNAQTRTALKLQLPWKHQFEFAGFYAAIEQGYYREHGLEVTPVEYQQGMSLTDEVVSGRAQYGVGGSSLIIDRGRGAPVRLLANIFQHSPLVLLSRADQNILSPAQMVGKRMMLAAYEKENASIIAMLHSESVSLDQIKVFDHSFNIDDLIEGKVDVISAYLTNEPGLLIERNVKFNITDPINYGIDFYGNNIFTSEDYVAKNPQQVNDFVQASLQGWQYALDHPEEIIQLILTKYSTHKSAKALAYEAETLERFILPDFIKLGSIDLDRLERIVDTYKQLKMLPSSFNLKGFVYKGEAGTNSIKLSQLEKQWIKQHPQVYIGVDPAWAPFEFIDDQGHYQGMGADYIELISRKTGINFLVQDNPTWQDVMEKARRGELSVLPAVMKSTQRSQFLDFSTPHIKYPMVIVSDRESRFISSLDQLDNKKVAVVKGYVTEDILRTQHPAIQLVSTENLQEALKQLAAGKVEAVVDNLASISYTISKLGISNLRISGATPYDFALSVAVPKQNKILLEIIQKALDAMTEEEHKAIRDKWLSIQYGQQLDYKKIIAVVVAVLVFIGSILLWNMRLATEVKARKKAEQDLSKNQQILQCRNNILELLSKGTQLKIILTRLIESLEQLQPQMIGSILLLDEQKKQLQDGVSVSLPDFYMQAINGLEIGLGAGCCGTAAYTGNQVIVSDILNHPYWEGYQELASSAGLRACWSQPVMSSKNEVIATFAIYSTEPSEPSESDLQLIHEFSILTSLVLENYYSHERVKKLSLAVEQSANMVIITNNEGIIEYVNPKFTEVTGYGIVEVIGKTPAILKSDQTDVTVYQTLWETLLSGKKWQGEFCNRKKNGELYWAWDNIAPIANEEGDITHFVAVQEDISVRKEFQRRLISSEAQFRNLIENTQVVSWEMDLETFCFTYVSPYAVTMTGHSIETWKEKGFWINHIHEEDRERSLKFCLRKSMHGQDHDFEYRLMKVSGGFVWVRDIVTVNKDLQGRPTSLRGILIDINEIKKAEETLKAAKFEAEHANRIKTEFLATMTHELRTPMNGVLGMAQILQETELNSEQRKNVEIILRSGNALLAIINDVLDFSKLEAKQVKLESSAFDLKQMCSNVLEMFIPESKNRGLNISLNYSPQCPTCFEGDGQRLQQVLINLMGNAVKFTTEGSVLLDVSSQPVSDQKVELTVSIKDTGIGIAEQKIPLLFDPFIQADQTTTRQFGGTGLGLSVSKKIMDLMNGDIVVNSELGKGAEFQVKVTLNVLNSLPASVSEQSRDLALNQMFSAKVLLVEDDKVNQTVALRMLSSMGLTVDLAENGRQAIDLSRDEQYDLIFMDCRMPVMDGYAATKIIRDRETDSHVPVIALSANSSVEHKQKSIDSGMNDVITKPFKKIQLISSLNQWLHIDQQKMAEDTFFIKKERQDEPDDDIQLVDYEVFEKFRREMDNDFSEIYQAILQSFEVFFEQFSTDLTQASCEELARYAHNLRSRSTYLGALKLAKIAAEIESLADNEQIAEAVIRIGQLKQAYQAVLLDLDEEKV